MMTRGPLDLCEGKSTDASRQRGIAGLGRFWNAANARVTAPVMQRARIFFCPQTRAIARE